MADVYILKGDGTPVDIVDNYIDIRWSRKLYGVGDFTMRVKFLKGQIERLEKGRLVAPQEEAGGFAPDQAFIIESLEYEVAPSGEEAVAASGRAFGGFLGERLILPGSGLAYDQQSGKAETVMKYYVSKNAGAGATSNRKLPGLSIAPDLARGPSVTYQGRYQTLADMLAEIARLTGLGWEVAYDAGSSSFVLDVVEGADHSASSPSPVYFDIDYETVTAQGYVTSDLGRKTFSYIGGKGEGATRPVQTAYLDLAEPSGFARREAWVDAQDADNVQTQIERGKKELAASGAAEKYAIELSRGAAPFRYRRDFDLGDSVVVRNTEWGLLADARIVAITNEFEPKEGRRVTKVELEEEAPTIAGRVRDAARQADAGRRR
ncbi:MAG: hypothetical protein BWY99_02318 [Synergistetes bacterium ADurb.BinA166]|nr:MAG: hypothetical protein BWY99_02318 [Synergistetes bacterium ADurb.BinA166]